MVENFVTLSFLTSDPHVSLLACLTLLVFFPLQNIRVEYEQEKCSLFFAKYTSRVWAGKMFSFLQTLVQFEITVAGPNII